MADSKMQTKLVGLLIVTSTLLTGCGTSSAPTNRNVATVKISTTQVKHVIPKNPFGVNVAVWDTQLQDSVVPTLLRNAGLNILRFPGGSTSDIYQWETNSYTRGYRSKAAPATDFAQFMTMVKAAKATSIVTVNYGSNASATAGGNPDVAARWVAYAKAHHDPVSFWEVGNEVYGKWETNFHKNKGASGYAHNFLIYARAMKAANPMAQIGAVLMLPVNAKAKAWNKTVLQIAGSQINFGIVHWYAQKPGHASDSGLLKSTDKIPAMMVALKKEIHAYGGSNASRIHILVTETNSGHRPVGKQTVSLVNALFLASDELTWLQSGVNNVDWWDLYNGISIHGANQKHLYGTTNYGDFGVLSSGDHVGSIAEPPVNTPFPPYYAMQMLHFFAQPGDTWLSATSSASLIQVYAVQQSDHREAVLVVNRSPKISFTINVNWVKKIPNRTTTTVYKYGEGSNQIHRTVHKDLQTLTVSPYSLTLAIVPTQ